MPAQTAKSGLMAKYGNKLAEAAKKHAGDEFDPGFQRLPGGISNGIARLTECGFQQVAAGKNYAGEYLFRAAGVVVSPKENDKGQIVKGLTTSVIEMICETKTQGGKVTTLEEHVANVQNYLKGLGVTDDDSLMAENLEATCAALKEAGPYFKFSTRESAAVMNPNGTVKHEARVWESWHGCKGLEDYTEDEPDAVVDNTAAAAPAPAAKPTTNGTAKPAPVKGKVGKTPEPKEVDYSAEEDTAVLVAAAEDQNEQAQQRLIELAVAAGVAEDTARGADTWAEVVEMIANAGEAAGGEEGTIPEAEQVWGYCPLDAKGKPGKQIEIEILSVDADKKTVTAKVNGGKTINDPKTKKPLAISWDKLETPA